MTSTLYLAWRYLVYNRWKAIILVASVTLIVYVPVGLRVLVSQSAAELTTRAAATPLLVGARGSPLQLVLNSLYFESSPPEITRYEQVNSRRALRAGESDSAIRSVSSTRAPHRGHNARVLFVPWTSPCSRAQHDDVR